MSHYKPYPVYKDSGIEWIGEVPEGWKIISIKCLEGNSANVVQTGPFGAQLHADDYVDEGVPLILIRNVRDMRIDDTNIPQVSLSDAERLSMYRLREGDIVFSRVGSIGRIALCTERENGWLISGQMLRLRMTNLSVDKKFVAYAFESPSLLTFVELQSVGSTRESINTEILRNMPLPIPDIIEQREISAFLDRQTARIDALITKKTRFIELLKEKRQALITHAVTKGLDPNVKMKDSGIDWIGEVPEHWEHCRVKNIVKVKVTDGPHETPELVDEGIPFISAEAVKNNKINFDFKRGYISKEDHEYFCKKCKPQLNDLFIIKSGATTGNIALVDFTDEFSIWSPLALIRCMESKYYYKFAFYVLQADNFQKQVQQRWSFGTQQNIGMGVIENLYIPLSLINEQHVIVDFLDRQTARIDLIIEKTQRSIDLLRERRSALITAAVTGKIDLRGSL